VSSCRVKVWWSEVVVNKSDDLVEVEYRDLCKSRDKTALMPEKTKADILRKIEAMEKDHNRAARLLAYYTQVEIKANVDNIRDLDH
jgi:hypothetical protein